MVHPVGRFRGHDEVQPVRRKKHVQLTLTGRNRSGASDQVGAHVVQITGWNIRCAPSGRGASVQVGADSRGADYWKEHTLCT